MSFVRFSIAFMHRPAAFENIVDCIGGAFSFDGQRMGVAPKSVHVLTVPHQRLDRASRQRLDDRNKGVAKFIQDDGGKAMGFAVSLPTVVVLRLPFNAKYAFSTARQRALVLQNLKNASCHAIMVTNA